MAPQTPIASLLVQLSCTQRHCKRMRLPSAPYVRMHAASVLFGSSETLLFCTRMQLASLDATRRNISAVPEPACCRLNGTQAGNLLLTGPGAMHCHSPPRQRCGEALPLLRGQRTALAGAAKRDVAAVQHRSDDACTCAPRFTGRATSRLAVCLLLWLCMRACAHIRLPQPCCLGELQLSPVCAQHIAATFRGAPQQLGNNSRTQQKQRNQGAHSCCRVARPSPAVRAQASSCCTHTSHWLR